LRFWASPWEHRTTYEDHLRHIGKCVVDFLLVLIELDSYFHPPPLTFDRGVKNAKYGFDVFRPQSTLGRSGFETKQHNVKSKICVEAPAIGGRPILFQVLFASVLSQLRELCGTKLPLYKRAGKIGWINNSAADCPIM